MNYLFKSLYFIFVFSDSRIVAYNSPKYTHDLASENFKLVPYFAQSFIKKHNLNTYQCQELIQEGSIGLIYASRKYDDTYNVKFSTYSSYWIKSYMSKYIKSIYNENRSLCLDDTRYIEPEQIPISIIDIDMLKYEERYFIQKKHFERMSIKQLAEVFNVPEYFIIRYNKKLTLKLKYIMSKKDECK